jgi:hypothetical protein
MADSPQSTSFASYASLATAAEVNALKNSTTSHVPEHNSAVAEIIAERLADPDDASFHMVLFPASMNLERGDRQADFFAPPAEMVGKIGCMIGLCLS